LIRTALASAPEIRHRLVPLAWNFAPVLEFGFWYRYQNMSPHNKETTSGAVIAAVRIGAFTIFFRPLCWFFLTLITWRPHSVSGHTQVLDQPQSQTLVAYVERLSQSNARCALGTVRHCRRLDCVLVLVTPYRSGPSRTWVKVKNPKAPAATREEVHRSDAG